MTTPITRPKTTLKPALTHSVVSLIFIAIASAIILYGEFIEADKIWGRITALTFILLFTILWFAYTDIATNKKISLINACLSYIGITYGTIFACFAINTITTTTVLTWFIVGETLMLTTLFGVCIFAIIKILNPDSET